LPGLAAVGGLVHVLATHVDPVVVEGRDRERDGPIPAVLHVRRRPSVVHVRPYAHVPHLAVAHVHAGDHAFVASRPHNVGVGRIRGGEAAFASAYGLEVAGCDAAAAAAAGERVAGPAEGGSVLQVAENVVGDVVIGRDVIHLREGQAHMGEAAAAVQAHRQPGV